MNKWMGKQNTVTHTWNIQFSSVQPLSRVRLSATPWIAARQASLSITNSRSSLRLMSIESVMPSSHLILCRPLLLLPPIPPSIRVFSNESALRMEYYSAIKRMKHWTHSTHTWWHMDTNQPANARDTCSIPGLRRFHMPRGAAKKGGKKGKTATLQTLHKRSPLWVLEAALPAHRNAVQEYISHQLLCSH